MLATPLSREKNDDKILRPHWSRAPDNIRIAKLHFIGNGMEPSCALQLVFFPRGMSFLDF